jgi:hypothetical protein
LSEEDDDAENEVNVPTSKPNVISSSKQFEKEPSKKIPTTTTTTTPAKKDPSKWFKKPGQKSESESESEDEMWSPDHDTSDEDEILTKKTPALKKKASLPLLSHSLTLSLSHSLTFIHSFVRSFIHRIHFCTKCSHHVFDAVVVFSLTKVLKAKAVNRTLLLRHTKTKQSTNGQNG